MAVVLAIMLKHDYAKAWFIIGFAMQIRALENQMRLVARRQGLSVVKSRSKAVIERFGGFMILDASGQIVAGGSPAAYSLRLDEVKRLLQKG